MFGKVKTSNYILRNLKEKDINDIFNLYQDERFAFFNKQGKIRAIMDASWILNNLIDEDTFGIYHKESKSFIGHVNSYINCFDYFMKIVISEDYEDSNVLKEIVDYYFNKVIKRDKIYLIVHPDNTKFINMVLNSGFSKDSEIEDYDVFGKLITYYKYVINKEDYDAK